VVCLVFLPFVAIIFCGIFLSDAISSTVLSSSCVFFVNVFVRCVVDILASVLELFVSINPPHSHLFVLRPLCCV
jgi:hypothetical protein